MPSLSAPRKSALDTVDSAITSALALLTDRSDTHQQAVAGALVRCRQILEMVRAERLQ